MDDIAIKVEHVSKTFKLPHEKQSSLKSALINFHKRGYETQQVLDDISFEVKKGEFFGIVGRNGSGKSTLLKLIAGIYTQDSGEIAIDGKLTPFIELGVGFNPELTGRENVFLNGALLGFNRKEMAAMYDEIVEFAELARFMDQKLKNYSSGMQVRLAFSIAIRANTDILVLDEVLAVGDANFQRKCFDYFQELKDIGKTVILVSHNMDSVKKFSTRALMLEDGKMIMIGDPEEVSDAYTKKNMASRSAPEQSQDKFDGIIKGVRMSSKSGRTGDSFIGGEPMKITIDYDFGDDAREINFGIGFYADSGGCVLSYNTQMDGYKVAQKKGAISMSFPSIDLLNGKYRLNIACFTVDELSPLDFKPRIREFSISNVGTASSYRGIVNLSHEWAIDEK